MYILGVPVTKRIKEYKQPYGGLIKPTCFDIKIFDDGNELNYDNENVHASLTGLAVDYLTRFMSGEPIEKAFEISLLGAQVIGIENDALKLIKKINGLDDYSIIVAYNLVQFDVYYRVGYVCEYKCIKPNNETINNVKIMVQRSMSFLDIYGPITKNGFSLKGAYTSKISAGDGDFLTQDTLWDMKVSKTKPNKNHTLQLLVYYIMGMKSNQKELFSTIKYIGIFNPRLNMVYRLAISEISDEVIEEVTADVIGYKYKAKEKWGRKKKDRKQKNKKTKKMFIKKR